MTHDTNRFDVARRTRVNRTLQVIPRHIGLIMDGNGRWAQRQGLPRSAGHIAAPVHLADLLCHCQNLGIGYVSLYTFSVENWRRPAAEVEGMFAVMSRFLETSISGLHDANIRLAHIGTLERVPSALQEQARAAIQRTRNNSGMTVIVAFNYGGRADIVQAARQLILDGVPPDQVTEAQITRRLQTMSFPDIDVLIRTSGEQRLSNFCLWNCARSFCWSTSVCWPDFRPSHLDAALDAYAQSQRTTFPAGAGHA